MKERMKMRYERQVEKPRGLAVKTLALNWIEKVDWRDKV